MTRRLHGAETRRESVLLIVLEPGCAWPSGIESPPSAHSADTIVLASDNENNPAALTRRALERVATIETRGHRLDRAVVVAGTDGAEARTTRAELARALLAHLSHAGAQLELVADADLPDSARHALMTLAGEIVERLPSTSLGVRLRFEPRLRAAPRTPALIPAREPGIRKRDESRLRRLGSYRTR